MAINVDKGSERELVPAGRYTFVLISIIDLGTQTGGDYGPEHKVIFEYELHKRKGVVRDSQGNPFTLSDWHSVKLGVSKPSTLRLALEALTGKTIEAANFSIDDSLLEKAFVGEVKHQTKNGKTRAIITSYMALDEDEEAPEPVSDSVYFEIDPNDLTIPDSVPKWTHSWIKKSREFGGNPNGGGGNGGANGSRAKVPAGADDDEDIPF